MGRDRRNEGGSEHFARLERRLMEASAWRALPPVAMALYPWLMLEWRGPKANNNGKIRLSVRQAAECMGVSPNTAAKAFHDLQAKGFLVVVEPAQLGIGGEATSPAFELTTIQLPHSSDRGGRNLYRKWREGKDYPVQKARANNPHGRQGKPKSHLKNSDSTVLEFKTKAK